MTSMRPVLLATVLLFTTACEPPTPALAKLVSPVLTAQRRLSGPLQVILTYDTVKTGGCGAVPNLRATLDGQNVAASAGAYVPEATDEALRCQFPGFLITPDVRATPREILFTDGVTTMSMTVNTLNLGSATPDSPPATFRPGNTLRWLGSPPAEGTTSWKVAYTPNGGAETTWGEGTNMPDSFTVTVPPVTVATSGLVNATWLVNTAVQQCVGASSCELVVQGNAPLNAVVVP